MLYKIHIGGSVMQTRHINSQILISSPGVAAGGANQSGYPKSGEKNGRSRGPSSVKPPIESPITRAIKTKVLIVHHAPLVRCGLAALIDASERYIVCAQTDNGPTAREMFVQQQ